MTNKKILSELDQLEAMADSVKDKCSKLRSLLGGKAAPSSARKGIDEMAASCIMKRNRNIKKAI